MRHCDFVNRRIYSAEFSNETLPLLNPNLFIQTSRLPTSFKRRKGINYRIRVQFPHDAIPPNPAPTVNPTKTKTSAYPAPKPARQVQETPAQSNRCSSELARALTPQSQSQQLHTGSIETKTRLTRFAVGERAISIL